MTKYNIHYTPNPDGSDPGCFDIWPLTLVTSTGVDRRWPNTASLAWQEGRQAPKIGLYSGKVKQIIIYTPFGAALGYVPPTFNQGFRAMDLDDFYYLVTKMCNHFVNEEVNHLKHLQFNISLFPRSSPPPSGRTPDRYKSADGRWMFENDFPQVKRFPKAVKEWLNHYCRPEKNDFKSVGISVELIYAPEPEEIAPW